VQREHELVDPVPTLFLLGTIIASNDASRSRHLNLHRVYPRQHDLRPDAVAFLG
jgi:hypothetical protein